MKELFEPCHFKGVLFSKKSIADRANEIFRGYMYGLKRNNEADRVLRQLVDALHGPPDGLEPAMEKAIHYLYELANKRCSHHPVLISETENWNTIYSYKCKVCGEQIKPANWDIV